MTKYVTLAVITFRDSTFLTQFEGHHPLFKADVVKWLNNQGYVFVPGRDNIMLFDTTCIAKHTLEEEEDYWINSKSGFDSKEFVKRYINSKSKSYPKRFLPKRSIRKTIRGRIR